MTASCSKLGLLIRKVPATITVDPTVTSKSPAIAARRVFFPNLCPLPSALCPLPFALCPLPSNLVFRGPLHVIDDDNIDRSAGRFQLESELFLYCREDRRLIGRRLIWRVYKI